MQCVRYSFPNEMAVRRTLSNGPVELSRGVQEVETVLSELTIRDVVSTLSKRPHGNEKERGKTNGIFKFFSPAKLNKILKQKLIDRGWRSQKLSDYGEELPRLEVDYVKNGVLLEVQFGKYAYVGYDILGKFTLWKHFSGREHLGIEVVFDSDPHPSLENTSLRSWTNQGQGSFQQTERFLSTYAIANGQNVAVPTIVFGIRPTLEAWRAVHEANTVSGDDAVSVC